MSTITSTVFLTDLLCTVSLARRIDLSISDFVSYRSLLCYASLLYLFYSVLCGIHQTITLQTIICSGYLVSGKTLYSLNALALTRRVSMSESLLLCRHFLVCFLLYTFHHCQFYCTLYLSLFALPSDVIKSAYFRSTLAFACF